MFTFAQKHTIMAHKDKILAKLKAKHPTVQNTVIEFIADKMDPKVTTETDVDTVVDAFENGPLTVADIALQITREGDKRVTEALKKKDPAKPDPAKPDPKKPEAVDPATPNPDPLAQILQGMTAINSRLDGMEKGKTKDAAVAKLHEKAKADKIPVYLLPSIETEEEIESAIATGKTNLAAIKQDLANEGFAQGTPPAGGGNTQVKAGDTKAIDAEIGSFVNTQLAAKGITPTKTT